MKTVSLALAGILTTGLLTAGATLPASAAPTHAHGSASVKGQDRFVFGPVSWTKKDGVQWCDEYVPFVCKAPK